MKENQHLKAINNALSFMVPLRMEAYSEVKAAAAALAARIEELERNAEIKDSLIKRLAAETGEQAACISALESDLKSLAYAANGLKGKLRECEEVVAKHKKGWEAEFIEKIIRQSPVMMVLVRSKEKDGAR